MNCSGVKCSSILGLAIVWMLLLQGLGTKVRCLSGGTLVSKRVPGFLARWTTSHSTVIKTEDRRSCFFTGVEVAAGNGLLCLNAAKRGHNLLSEYPVLLFSQADVGSGGSDHVRKSGSSEDNGINNDAIADEKRGVFGNNSSSSSGTVRVMYSGGTGENVSVNERTEDMAQGRKGAPKSRVTSSGEEIGYIHCLRRSGNSYKDKLYDQLLRLFSFASERLREDDLALHEELESFIRDLRWDVWDSAATSQGAVDDFYGRQLERFEGVMAGLKAVMGKIVESWQDVINEYAPWGRLPLIKLTKTLGVQDERDAMDLQLLIEELIQNYHKEQRQSRFALMSSIGQLAISRLVSVVDSFLPLKPAGTLLKFCSLMVDLVKKGHSWLYARYVPDLPFNEEGIFKFYEISKSCIHTPEWWPRECQPLPPHGGGSWKLTFLGTGSRKPSKTRLTSAILFSRLREDPLWMFDCGESSINRVREAGFCPTRVRKVFLTHLHGDHCYGLFSFLHCSTTVAPLEVYGPSGTSTLIADVLSSSSRSQALRTFVVNELVSPGEREASSEGTKTVEKPFKVNYIRADGKMHYAVYEDESVVIRAAPLTHTINTVGYVLEEKLAESAKESGREPRKFVLCQDTADSRWLQPLSMDADLLIHEATINVPTNSGSEMLMRLTRNQDTAKIPRAVLDRLDKLLLTEEMKFQMYQCTVSSLRYYYDRKVRSLRESSQLQQAIKHEIEGSEGDMESRDTESHPAVPASDGIKNDVNKEGGNKPNWTDIVKRVVAILKLYCDSQAAARLVAEVENLLALIGKLRSSDLQTMKSLKSRSMQGNMKALATLMLMREGYPVTPPSREEVDASLTVSRAIDDMAPLIFQYWAGIVGKSVPLRKDGNYGYMEWETLYNEYARLNGHSTCQMAGEFAGKIRAKKLFLTHFSQNHPDVLDRENILTMARVTHSALRGYYRGLKKYEGKNLKVGAAWDLLTITL